MPGIGQAARSLVAWFGLGVRCELWRRSRDRPPHECGECLACGATGGFGLGEGHFGLCHGAFGLELVGTGQLARAQALRASAMIIVADLLFISNIRQLAALGLQNKMPAIFPFREFAAAGGLISYGTDLADTYRLAGIYTGRILAGEKPANLPVQQATKVSLIINLKTAKAFGLEVPPLLLARADEVIE